MSEPDKYVEIAAQIWCQPGLSHKEMDCELAYAFAAALREQGAEIDRLKSGEFICKRCGLRTDGEGAKRSKTDG